MTTKFTRRLVSLLLTASLGIATTAAFRRTAPAAPSTAKEQNAPMAQTAPGWVKYAANPVLGGKLGTCFDCCVLREKDGFQMWFSWRPRKSIGLAESKDGVTWGPAHVVLEPNSATNWEEDINRPSVVLKDGEYYMWYTGQARGHSRIGLATSPDGRVWTRRSVDPVLSPDRPWEKVAVMCPDVMWDDHRRVFRMWYSGGDQYEPNAIGVAESKDGLHWTKRDDNPIFRPDPGISWEKDRVTACHVVADQGGYTMFYIGFHDESFAQIGLARSPDGIGDWERYGNNPIIRSRTGDANAWDADAAYKPYALYDNGRWMLWYNGRQGGFEQIGLATHPGADLWAATPGK